MHRSSTGAKDIPTWLLHTTHALPKQHYPHLTAKATQLQKLLQNATASNEFWVITPVCTHFIFSPHYEGWRSHFKVHCQHKVNGNETINKQMSCTAAEQCRKLVHRRCTTTTQSQMHMWSMCCSDRASLTALTGVLHVPTDLLYALPMDDRHNVSHAARPYIHMPKQLSHLIHSVDVLNRHAAVFALPMPANPKPTDRHLCAR